MWDITDSRHAVVGRDDVANLGRMYHHLFVDLLRTRWPDEARWMVHPDENSAIDWSAVEDFLRGKALVGRPIEGELLRRLRSAFRLEGVVPVDSADHPLVQVADLLAGLAAFSRSDYEGFTTWESERYGHEQLFPSDAAAQRSRSDLARYEVLRRFNTQCKGAKLGVSLGSRKYLWTRKPENPINFWWWEPQTPADRAPRRDSERASVGGGIGETPRILSDFSPCTQLDSTRKNVRR